MSEKVSGNLIIIGGAEDKKGDKDILRRVLSTRDASTGVKGSDFV